MELLLQHDVSPALRGLLGYLGEHPRFVLHPDVIQGRFDNGERRSIQAKRVHNTSDDQGEDLRLADLDGDVWVFSEVGAMPLCSSAASTADAISAFRGLVGASALVVV